METTIAPNITQRAFFALPAVVAAQAIQKANPYGSAKHRQAFEAIRALAESFGAASFIGSYED